MFYTVFRIAYMILLWLGAPDMINGAACLA